MSARGYAAIGLFNPKTPENVGGAMRACRVYGASMIAVTGARDRWLRHPTDTQKTFRHVPTIRCDDLRSMIPFGCIPVAVDIIPDATPLPEYEHPQRAFYIFGPEDGTLGKEITDWCRDVIYVPMQGCMNLAASVNVVLYDRMAKNFQRDNEKD